MSVCFNELFNVGITTFNKFFCLVKKFNKDNSSNYPKQLLTEILINRDFFKKGKINGVGSNSQR